MTKSAAEGALEPCGFMKRWINEVLDDSLRGVMRLYANYHLSTCTRCRTALAALRDLRMRLRALAANSAAGDQAVGAAWTAELGEKLDRVEQAYS
jgi:RNase P subunit RPR2